MTERNDWAEYLAMFVIGSGIGNAIAGIPGVFIFSLITPAVYYFYKKSK